MVFYKGYRILLLTLFSFLFDYVKSHITIIQFCTNNSITFGVYIICFANYESSNYPQLNTTQFNSKIQTTHIIFLRSWFDILTLTHFTFTLPSTFMLIKRAFNDVCRMELVKLTRASFNRIGYMHAIEIRGDTNKSVLREWEKLYTVNYLF